MKALKFISKVLLFILSIIFSIILIVDIVAYNTRDITSKLISEEQIKKCIDNLARINYIDYINKISQKGDCILAKELF